MYNSLYSKVIKYNKSHADLAPFYTALAHDPNEHEHNLQGLVDFTSDHDHPLAPLYQKLWEQREEKVPYKDWGSNALWHSGHTSSHFPTEEKDIPHTLYHSGSAQHQFIPTAGGKVIARVHISDYMKPYGEGYSGQAVISPEEAEQHIKTLGELGHKHHWVPNQFAEPDPGLPETRVTNRETVPTEEAINRLRFNIREHGH